MQSNQYSELLNKLDSFTRKFYLNQILRGSIFSAVYVLALFLAVNLLEYHLFLAPTMRKVLFYGFVGSSLLFIARFVGLPLLHYYRLGKLISHEQAAQIIGKHFAEVKDKLLNILQLNTQTASIQFDLLQASINQKISDLRPINFSLAVDLGENKKYVKYLVPPVLVLLFIIIAAPSVISEGTKRLYYNNRDFEKEAPFRFVIANENLKALQFSDFTLEVKIEGDALPAEVYLETAKNKFKLKKKSADVFTHEFTNLQQSVEFKLQASGFYSQGYKIEVLPKPVISSFDVKCDYPAYTNRTDETLRNVGDLSVPQGTKLSWRFIAANTSNIQIKIGDSLYTAKANPGGDFLFSKTALQNIRYTLFISNENVLQADSVSYTLNVVPDLYPTISVTEKRDTANPNYYYYIGEVGDDYGIRNLTFSYSIAHDDSSSKASSINKVMNVAVPAGSSQARFTHFWSWKELGIQPGDRMTYYFEVWDNDGINGSKSSRSDVKTFNMPSEREIEKELSKDSKDLKDEMKASMKDAKDLKEKLREAQDKMMEKKNLNWEDKKNLSDLADKQKQLQEQLKEIKNKLSENTKKQEEFKPVSEQVKQKQEKLQELFDKVLDDEIKKLYEKLEKMLEELNKKDAMEKMSDMEMSNEKLEKELDRMLELFKKLEFNQKLEETANKLEQLAKKQEELAKQTEQQKDAAPNDAKAQEQQKQLQEEQKKLQEELKEAKEDLKDLKKLNEESKSEQDFKEAEKNLETAEKQMEDAQDQMKEQQNSKAGGNQKSASNNMKNAAQKMKDMKSKMESDAMAEDMKAIRQLLENIVRLSFDQEKLMADLKAVNVNNPKYVQLMTAQQKIKENSKMVEDSLFALARRQESISSFVTKQMNDVNRYLAKAITRLEDRYVSNALSDQQFVMTGYNNLALMLSESMQNMQQQMAESESQKPQDGKPNAACKKPGKNNKGMPNMSQMQKQLNDKINQLGEMMKRDGQQKGGDKGFQRELSKQFSELSAKQAELRKALEKVNQEQNKDGKNTLGNLGEAIQKMNETETQLVNKQLTTEMLKRQQDIFTRLLEAENAQRQRDEQPERESKTGNEQERKMPPSLEEYLKQQQQQADFYKTVPPSLKPYYKQLTEQYFRHLAGEQ